MPNGVNGVNGHVNGVNGHVNGINGHTNGEPGGQPKPSLRLSFTEYRRISNLLVLHLRRAEEGKRGSTSYNWEVSRIAFFFFFLNHSLQRSDQYSVLQLRKRRSWGRVRWWTGTWRRSSQRSTLRRTWSIRRVWSRRSSTGWCTMWVHPPQIQSSVVVIQVLTITDEVCVLCVFQQDHILIELSQAGLKGSEPASTEEEAVLVVNPNYILEDWTPFSLHPSVRFPPPPSQPPSLLMLNFNNKVDVQGVSNCSYVTCT